MKSGKQYEDSKSAKVNESYFSPDNNKKNVKDKAIRGGAYSIASQLINLCVHFVSTMVLARLLSPNDYGLVAMVTVVVGFVMMFQDMGLSVAIIQKKHITHEQVSSLFWVNAAIGMGITGLLIAGAPFIALFYGETKLVRITIILSITMLLSGLTVQHQALMRRKMQFDTLAIIDILGVILGSAFGILLAFKGAGYWALVGLPVGTAVIRTILVWFLCKWRPGLYKKRTGLREFLSFGGNVSGFTLVNYFSRNLDNILLGRFWGPQVLGYYSRAYNIMMMPVSNIRAPLEQISMPILSRMQDDPLQYRQFYLKLTGFIAFLSMPLMTLLFVEAENVIHLMLGSQWGESVKIFQMLCFVSFLQPVSTTIGLVLLSRGRSAQYLRFGVATSIVTALSFIVGLPWGALGVAIGYLISNYVRLLPSLWYCFRGTKITIVDFLIAIMRPSLICVAMGIGVYCLRILFNGMPPLVSICASSCLGVLFYLAVWAVIPDGLAYLRELYKFRLVFSKKKNVVKHTVGETEHKAFV